MPHIRPEVIFSRLQKPHTKMTVIVKNALKTCRVRNLKFARDLNFTKSKTLVNFIKKMMFCFKFGIFQFRKL